MQTDGEGGIGAALHVFRAVYVKERKRRFYQQRLFCFFMSVRLFGGFVKSITRACSKLATDPRWRSAKWFR